MKIILLTLIVLSTFGCTQLKDNSGKCFSGEKRKYSKQYNFLIFNNNNDYVFWEVSEMDIIGPSENRFLSGVSEIECPKKLVDRGGFTTKELKKYGVYEEVTKYINIE